MHSHEPERSTVGCKRCVAAIRFFDLNLPKTAVSVYEEDWRCFAMKVYIRVQTGYWVRVSFGCNIKVMIINAKVGKSVFLWHKHYWRRLFCLSCLNNSLQTYFIDHLFFKLFDHWHCLADCKAYWLWFLICQLKAMLRNMYQSKVTALHGLKLAVHV